MAGNTITEDYTADLIRATTKRRRKQKVGKH